MGIRAGLARRKAVCRHRCAAPHRSHTRIRGTGARVRGRLQYWGQRSTHVSWQVRIFVSGALLSPAQRLENYSYIHTDVPDPRVLLTVLLSPRTECQLLQDDA